MSDVELQAQDGAGAIRRWRRPAREDPV